MKTSNQWIAHFKHNALQHRVDWSYGPSITAEEIKTILPSLQAWQLGETSDGSNLIAASTRYAFRAGDPAFVEAMQLFIKEEQKHGANLGRYIDEIGEKRLKKDWGDSLFRWARHFNTSMESWTLAVIVVESTAQVFYQSLKDATRCGLLKQICTDILIDEAHHITFQTERMAIIYQNRSQAGRSFRKLFYKAFFYAVSLLVWFVHRRLFKAGGNTFSKYMNKMRLKYYKTLHPITTPLTFEIA